MKITGTTQYKKLSGGFWGITDQEGGNWRPTNMPKELQKEGLKVKIEAKELTTQAISIFMWGTSIEILRFKVID